MCHRKSSKAAARLAFLGGWEEGGRVRMEVGETGSPRWGGRPTSKGHHGSTSADPAHLLNHHPGDVAGEEWRFVSLGFLLRGF